MTADCIQQTEADFMTRRSTQRLACFFALGLFLVAAPMFLRAQVAGPMQPPTSGKRPAPLPPGKPDTPALPPEEIIRRFTFNEDAMARAFVGYTFQKSIRIEELGTDNKPTGQLEIVTQQMISSDGRLYEKMIRREPSTLHALDIQRGDSSDLLAPAPVFPLTTSQVPKYEITYGGKQPLDDLSAYFFSVKPRALDRTHAYFSGVVWVDQQDFVIVKMIGKWVTETGDVTSATLPFTVFETYRQEVGKNLWFPAYSRSDENFEAGKTTVPIRVIVKWSDYKPFENAGNETPAAPKSSDSSGKP
jgi:hypothetical protein